MDLKPKSPLEDNVDTIPSFRKPSSDAANRKYRRRSSVDGYSSPESPERERDSRVSDHRQLRKENAREKDRESSRSRYRSGEINKYSDTQSSRNSRDYSKRDVDDEERTYQKTLSRSGQESKGHRSRDKDRVSSSLDQHKYRDRDISSDRTGSSRRYSNNEGIRSGERDKHDKDVDSRGKDNSGKEHAKEDKKKYAYQESKRANDRYNEEMSKKIEGKSVITRENQEFIAKKPKLFSLDAGSDYGKHVKSSSSMVNENQSSMAKQSQDDKMNAKEGLANICSVTNDLNTAKIAAIKAAELVNRNLTGMGCMSTEQKKKLLWGNKNTAAEVPAHRWDTSLFSDHERREKFNKLMGVKENPKTENSPNSQQNGFEKHKELQLDLEKQYTAGLRRRDGRTVGLGL